MTMRQVVLASAGTGKTFQLTNRYIGLLARGVDPSSILATTFTRKAAGEILQRILSRLAAAAVGERALTELREHVDPSLTHERCRDLTAQLASSIHRLNVKTLDSFFGWMSGCFGLEMGIAPGWRIISDEEDADLRSAAIQQALSEADREQLVTFMEMLSGNENGRTVHSAIERAVRAAHLAYIETAAHPGVWTAFGPDADPLSEEAIARAIRAMEAVEMPTTRAGSPNRRWQQAHERSIDQARARQWEAFIANGLAKCILCDQPTFYNIEIDADIICAYQPLVDHARTLCLHAFLARNIATRELMARFDTIYQKLKEEISAWRFDDIPRRLLAYPLEGRLDHLYYRLDAHIRHIMLDEFQDTSIQQFHLIEPILDELMSHRETDRSVFIVGDVKQSLYSWRSAEPELLPSLSRRWEHLQQSTLELNFRSSPVILDTVNEVFEHIASNPALEAFPGITGVWQDGYRSHRAARTTMAGRAALYVAPDAGDRATRDEQTMLTLRFAAERVREILGQQPRARIGILVRANRWIPQIIFELAQLGISASEEGGNPLTDSPPVAAAVSLLQLADHPGDSAALYHVATTPLGPIVGLMDPFDHQAARRIAAGIRQRLMRDGYASWLRRLLLRAAPAMDARGVSRFEQLIDLAQAFDAEAGTRPAQFVRIVQERGIQEPGRQNVSVMTIHQSKGLEFDAVVLPELDRRWTLNHDQVLLDRRDETGDRTPFAPVTAATRYPGQTIRRMHDGLAELHRHWQQRQIGEELCCLYVALTRAVHVLEMIIPPPKGSGLSLCAGNVLQGALAAEGDLIPGQQAWQLRSGPDDDWIAQIADEEARAHPPEVEPETIELAFAAPGKIPTGRLRRRSPSSLEGGDTVDLGLVWSTAGESARDRGSLMHAWFESIGWLENGLPADDDLLGIAGAHGFDPGGARDLLEAFKASLTGEVADALSRVQFKSRYPGDADELRIRREWPFAVRDTDPETGKPLLLSGIFDRVVIVMRSGQPTCAEIIDFKTDRLESGDDELLDRAVATYRPQILAYRRALAQLLEFPSGSIGARLLFTDINRVVEIPGGS